MVEQYRSAVLNILQAMSPLAHACVSVCASPTQHTPLHHEEGLRLD